MSHSCRALMASGTHTSQVKVPNKQSSPSPIDAGSSRLCRQRMNILLHCNALTLCFGHNTAAGHVFGICRHVAAGSAHPHSQSVEHAAPHGGRGTTSSRQRRCRQNEIPEAAAVIPAVIAVVLAAEAPLVMGSSCKTDQKLAAAKDNMATSKLIDCLRT